MRIEQHTPFVTPIFTIQYNELKSHKQLTNEALSLEQSKDGNQISNVGGFQSKSFTTENRLVNKFWFEILPQVQQFISLYHIGCNYDTNLDTLWYNVNRKHNFNQTHNHPNSVVSGVYYLEVPKDSGRIVFDTPDKGLSYNPFYKTYFNNFNEYNSSKYYIKPNKGLLILFPSHIDHYVEPNNNIEPRISLAFNVQIVPRKNDG